MLIHESWIMIKLSKKHIVYIKKWSGWKWKKRVYRNISINYFWTQGSWFCYFMPQIVFSKSKFPLQIRNRMWWVFVIKALRTGHNAHGVCMCYWKSINFFLFIFYQLLTAFSEHVYEALLFWCMVWIIGNLKCVIQWILIIQSLLFVHFR